MELQDLTPETPNSRTDRGFTLVEILIAIVLVGILSAVVVVGIGNLTSKGSTAACQASLDAAKSATVVYYSSNSNTWPATMTAMTSTTPAALTLPSGVTLSASGLVATGSGWTLTMTPSAGGNQPTFVCA
ncbi:MAG: type II secretion system protein [Acidimicrobiales bacterium]